LRLLHDETETLAQLHDVVLSDVNVVDEDGAELRVVEPHDEADKRGLALA